MRVAVTGASGMLGSAVLRQLSDKYELFAMSRTPGSSSKYITWDCFDLLDTNLLQTWLKEKSPDVIIHCAANINVDECENNTANAIALHVGVTTVIADYADRFARKLIYISTDSVFNGKLQRPYTESDKTDPLNNYAKTKLLGEEPVLECNYGIVLRTNILGRGFGRKATFFDWLLNGLRSKDSLKLFDDVLFSPITVDKCSAVIENLINAEIRGLFHCGTRDRVSKYEFGMLTAEIFQLPRDRLECVSVETFCFAATRPKNMSLDSSKLQNALNIILPTVETTILDLHKNCADFNIEKSII